MAAEVGQRFPDFSLQNQDGKTVTLDDFAGKWLVRLRLSKRRHARLYDSGEVVHGDETGI